MKARGREQQAYDRLLRLRRALGERADPLVPFFRHVPVGTKSEPRKRGSLAALVLLRTQATNALARARSFCKNTRAASNLLGEAEIAKRHGDSWMATRGNYQKAWDAYETAITKASVLSMMRKASWAERALLLWKPICAAEHLWRRLEEQADTKPETQDRVARVKSLRESGQEHLQNKEYAQAKSKYMQMAAMCRSILAKLKGDAAHDRCRFCQGTAKMPCPDCRERGRATNKASCADCDGTGYVKCTRCDGSGNSTCTRCKGAGRRKISSMSDRTPSYNTTCYPCNGTGVVHKSSYGVALGGPCRGCGAGGPAGKMPCRSCERRGLTNDRCATCNGVKKVRCTHCVAGKEQR